MQIYENMQNMEAAIHDVFKKQCTKSLGQILGVVQSNAIY